MELYPYILARVGSLPFSTLEVLRFSELEALQIYVEKKLDKGSQTPEIKSELKDFEEQFESFFQKGITKPREVIQALAGHEILQKGLVQSSHSLVDRIEKYRKHPLNGFRKKERQTERTVAQYLARCAAKTSPFSTFTNLSINNLDGSLAIQDPASSTQYPASKFRINNYLLAYIKDLLSNFDPFFVQHELKVNASLRKEGEEYVFLINSRNVESIQRIEADGVVEKVLEVIEFFKGRVAFRQMIVELKQFVDADAGELGLYVLQLQRYGLLEWHWPVSGNDTDWDIKFCEWLKSMKPFTLRGSLVNSLDLLRKNAEACEVATVEERKQLILESYETIKECCAQLKSGQWEGLPIEENAFTNFEAGDFIFIPERLYYEDSSRSAVMQWPVNSLETAVKELDELLQLILPLQLNDMGMKMHYFFADHFEEDTTVGLMEFYTKFFEQKEWRLEPLLSNTYDLREKFCEKLEKQIRYSDDFTVDLSLSDLRMIVAQNELDAAPPRSSYSYGTLIQLLAHGGTYKSYVDATFTGYGKMLGRFLHLFPAEQTTSLQDWISNLRGSQSWADNIDASIFNANAHPDLLPLEIAMPGGENKLPPSDQIAIADLKITFNKDENRLALFHKDQEITVFDLGLEAIGSRSPMYQMLSTFAKPQPKIGVFKMLLISLTRRDENDWVKLPRIYIGEHLIMQRKAWGVPQKDIPKRFNSETDAAYFLRVNLWRTKYKLPEKVFITLDPIEFNEEAVGSGQRKGEGHKPQFIDFLSPALVSHLGRELVKAEGYVKVEEMLPGESDLLDVNGEPTVSELMIMWSGAVEAK